MVLYGCMLIQRCMVLYVAVWLYGARREAGQGVAPVWSEIQLNTAKYSRIPYSRPYSKLGLYAHTAASRGARRRYTAHSEKTGGGGLEPSAANPDYWDLVPYSENNRSKRSRLPASQRQSSAQLQFLRDESPQRALFEHP